jgi:hypothetical protein
MTEFVDDFARADEAIETGGDWAALNSNNATSNVVAVLDGRMVNNDPTRSAAAFYVTTKPAAASQEMQANITASVQGSNCHVDIGVLGKQAAAGWSSNPLGVWARFAWLANGARRLSIHRFLPGDSAATTVVTTDLVMAGAIESSSHLGALLDAGALGSVQNVRLVVEEQDWGLRARVFLNTNDDDRYALEARLTGDWLGTGDTAQADGSWWIGFGASGGAAGDQAVLAVAGSDYDLSDDKALIEQRDDQPRLSELRQDVLYRYTSAGGTNRPAEVVDAAIRYATIEALLILGDKVETRREEATVALTIDAVTGRATGFTAKMLRVLDIRDATTHGRVAFNHQNRGVDGTPVLRVSGSSGDYLVTYSIRPRMPKAPDDPVPFPPEHVEMLIYGACQRLAESDGKPDLAMHWKEMSLAAMRTVAKDLQRTTNLERQVIQPRYLGPVLTRRRRAWLGR